MPLHKILTLLFLPFCSIAFAQTYTIRIHNNGYLGRLNNCGERLDTTNVNNTALRFFFIKGDTSITLKPVAKDQYFLNTGATIGGPGGNQTTFIYFYFKNDGSGKIDSILPKSSANIGQDQKSITFNTHLINIDPGKYNRAWSPTWGVYPQIMYGNYFGKKSIVLINGLTYSIDHLPPTCVVGTQANGVNRAICSNFYFTVSDNGNIKLYDDNRLSAQGIGNTLKFKTVWMAFSPNEISNGQPMYIPEVKNTDYTIIPNVLYPFIRGVINKIYFISTDGTPTYYFFKQL